MFENLRYLLSGVYCWDEKGKTKYRQTEESSSDAPAALGRQSEKRDDESCAQKKTDARGSGEAGRNKWVGTRVCRDIAHSIFSWYCYALVQAARYILQ